MWQTYIQLPFGVAPAGNMFQKKIHKLFTGMHNVFSIADDILIAGFDKQGKDHNTMLDKVFRIWRQVNLKLNKDKGCNLNISLKQNLIFKS